MNCSNCGTSLRAESRFCHECGTPIAALPEAAPQPPAEIRVEGVRRPVQFYSDWSAIVDVPAHFMQATLLDINRWAQMMDAMGIPLASVKEAWWEGEPWQPGSVIAFKMKAAGIPTTSRMTVLPAGQGELCRVWQKMTRFAPGIAYAYFVNQIGPDRCEVKSTTWREGGIDRTTKWLAGKMKGKVEGWAARKFKDAVERAWAEEHSRSHPHQ